MSQFCVDRPTGSCGTHRVEGFRSTGCTQKCSDKPFGEKDALSEVGLISSGGGRGAHWWQPIRTNRKADRFAKGFSTSSSFINFQVDRHVFQVVLELVPSGRSPVHPEAPCPSHLDSTGKTCVCPANP